MVVISECLRRIERKHLSPVGNSVACAHVERVTLERQWLPQARKLLIVKSGSFAQGARHGNPADCVVLVCKGALKCHEQMTAVAYIVDQFVQHSIACDI